jgi:hypothetical protein
MFTTTALVFSALAPCSSVPQSANPLAGQTFPSGTQQGTSSLVSPTGFTDRNTWAAAAGGSPTLVDFDSLADGALVTGTGALLAFGIQDTTGTGLSGGPTTQHVYCSCTMNFPMFTAGTLPSEPNYFANDRQPPDYATGKIRVTFVSPTTACGAYVADVSALGTFSIEVFDSGGTSLGVVTVPPRTLPNSFAGLISTVPFASAEFRADGPGDSWGLDNLEHVGSGSPSFCFGDGTQSTPCPCGNNGQPGHGCDNSGATGGARLVSTGMTSPDTIVLTSSGEKPTAPSIFLQGDTTILPVNFGDGLRCVHGVLKRLYVKAASGGVATAPQAGDPSISARSAALGDPIPLGATRYYQTYYRDPDPVFCPSPSGNTFNISDGLSIVW